MTRETKIGLLVGLAFIIVVGILLSEHLTTTTERPAAPLADAGGAVRDGMAAPGVNMRDDAPALRPADPVAPVPTARDLSAQPQSAPAHVSIGGPGNQAPIVIDNHSPITPAPALTGTDPVAPISPVDQPIVTRLPADPFANSTDPLHQAARAQGEPLIPANPGVSNVSSNTLAANNVREYKAQPGDSLSRIAALLPGGNTKTNREAVVKLNPILQKDPNKVIAGRTYLLPTDQPAPAPTPTPIVEQPSAIEPVAKKPETAPAAQYRTYTVKKGDTLTRIAMNELGSKDEIDAIKKLNESVLKGSDLIKIDMKLKLPVKAVASN